MVHYKNGDLNVNRCENKKLTNTHSSGADELVELTPVSIRLRKKYLDEKDRKRFAKAGTLQYLQK